MSKRKSQKPPVTPDAELENFKQFLGPVSGGYNDAQLCQLRREMYGMAELLLDYYLLKIREHSRCDSGKTTA